MAFNGSGTYTRTNGTHTGSTVWAQDDAAGVDIVTDRHDTHDQDIATALSLAICKDGQSTPTANIGLGGFKLTNVGAATARTDAIRTGQIQDGAVVWGGTTGGSANAQTITLTPAVTAYVTGMRISFIAGATNTSATVTLNVNSVGTKNIRMPSDSAPKVGFIRSGTMYTVVYSSAADSAAGAWIIIAGKPSGYIAYSPSYGINSGSFAIGTENFKAWQFIDHNLIQVDLDFGATLSSTPGTTVTATLPFNAIARGVDQIGTASASVSAALPQGGQCYVGSGSATLNILLYDARNWSAATYDHIKARIIYEV